MESYFVNFCSCNFLGDRNFSKIEGTEQRRKVLQIVRHPKFNVSTANNDYALVELESPVEINDFVRPICLPRRPKGRYVNRNCKILGWGINFVDKVNVFATRPEVIYKYNSQTQLKFIKGLKPQWRHLGKDGYGQGPFFNL